MFFDSEALRQQVRTISTETIDTLANTPGIGMNQ
jgi:hypothetical protein